MSLPAGQYFILTDNTAGLVNQIWKGSVASNVSCAACSPKDTGTAVTVGSGATANIDFVLPSGAKVKGRITDASTGAGLQGIVVLVYPRAALPFSSSATSAVTSASGDYTTTAALPPGTYAAKTSGGPGLGYVDRIYDGVTCLNSGCSAASRFAGMVEVPSRWRLRRLVGTRRPSSRHSRWTALRFTRQPCRRSWAWARR